LHSNSGNNGSGTGTNDVATPNYSLTAQTNPVTEVVSDADDEDELLFSGDEIMSTDEKGNKITENVMVMSQPKTDISLVPPAFLASSSKNPQGKDDLAFKR